MMQSVSPGNHSPPASCIRIITTMPNPAKKNPDLHHTTSVSLKPKVRAETIEVLNALLADLIDLHSQTKQAHWNVRGPHFIMLHELFDKVGGMVEPHIDPIAERIATLGGVALGTTRLAAKHSRLKEFPTDGKNGFGYLDALVERYAAVANAFRDGVKTTGDLGDAATSDLLTGPLRQLDLALWFLEAHHAN